MRFSQSVTRHLLPLLLPLLGLLAPFGALAQSSDPMLDEAQRLLKQGQHAQALTKTDAYISGKPKDAQGRFLKGLILTEMKRSGEAILIFKKLTEDFPELPEPYNNLAVLYAQDKQYEKARRALEAAIKTHPAYAVAHENLGDIYAKLASQAYGKALQIDSGNTAAQTKIAMIRDLVPPTPQIASVRQDNKPNGDSTRLAGGKQIAVTALPPQNTAAAPTPPVIVAAVTPAPAVSQTVTTKPATEAQPAPVTVPASAANNVKPNPPQTAEQEIMKAVHGWADAWSQKNVRAYLAHYAADFKTPSGLTRKAWEQDRQKKVGKPGKIEVSAEQMQIELSGKDKANVKFRQIYRSANLNSSATKTLELTRSNGRWLIQQERVN